MEKNTVELFVRIYSVVFWVGACLYVGLGLAFFFGGSLLGAGLYGGAPETGLFGGALAVMGAMLGAFLLAVGVLSGFAGYGLWVRRSWARVLAIVLFVLWLLNFPLGTALGAFGIYLFGFDEHGKRLFGVKVAKKGKKIPTKKKAAKKKAKKRKR